ncbi:MAG: acylphosphatase [Bacteroidetes bacterium]|nr:acylphosphatase [Bacteroidota bacterium]
MKTFHIIISGKVQGVFFRATAQKIADKLRLAGRVMNTAKGDVEIIVSGPSADLENFIKWCNIGPQRARVEKVTSEEIDYQPFDSFEIIRKV